IEAIYRGRLEAHIAGPDGGVATVEGTSSDHQIEEQLIAPFRLVLFEGSLVLVPIPLSADGERGGPAPDAARPRAASGPAPDVRGPGDELHRLQPILNLDLLAGGCPDVQPGIVVVTGGLDPERRILVDRLAARRSPRIRRRRRGGTPRYGSSRPAGGRLQV